MNIYFQLAVTVGQTRIYLIFKKIGFQINPNSFVSFHYSLIVETLWYPVAQ